jgi:hypothetical protein
MTRDDSQAWATAYTDGRKNRDLLNGDHPLWRSIGEFMNMGRDVSPDDCWTAILSIFRESPGPGSGCPALLHRLEALPRGQPPWLTGEQGGRRDALCARALLPIRVVAGASDLDRRMCYRTKPVRDT